jgi:RHS repeat-associated protein
MRLGNGRFESSVFNSRLQPTQIALGTSATNTSLLKLEYDYGNTDNNGNVKSQTITVPNMANPLIQTYAYDALNRLQSAEEKSNNVTQWKQTFTFDRYGNRRFDMANTTMPDSQSNQLITNPQIDPSNNRFSANQGYDYDQSGNVTKDATDKRFAYDAENKQASFGTNGSSTNGGSYFYDGDGRRVKKVVGTETTIFVYNASGQLVAEYTTTAPTNPQTSYLTIDTLGSPRINTDANGQVTARHDYLPFGEEIASGTGGRNSAQGYFGVDSIRQKFTLKERDSETGLDYFGARYYSNAYGRFTTPDDFTGGPTEMFAAVAAHNPTFYAEIAEPQSLNKYQYCLNNPFRYIDPDGHQTTTADALKKGQQDQEVVKVYTAGGPKILDYKMTQLDKVPGTGEVPVGGKFQIYYKYQINNPTDGTKPEDYGRVDAVDYSPTKQNPDGGPPKDGGTFAQANNLGLIDVKTKVIGEGKEATVVEKTETYEVKERKDMKPNTTGAINYKIVVTDPVNTSVPPAVVRSQTSKPIFGKGPGPLYVPIRNVLKQPEKRKMKSEIEER